MANLEQIVLMDILEEAENQAAAPARLMHARNDAFSLSDALFCRNFRLSKQLALQLIGILEPHMAAPTRSSALDISTKVLIALNFFGTGSYQTPVGSHMNLAVSQSSVSRAITEVVEALNCPEIYNQWIKFPANMAELDIIRQQFFNKYGFPGVIGCVDCTHIAIVPPSSAPHSNYDERSYVNRKNYHSINVQLICDINLKIIHINALFPGSTHDSYIWNNSAVVEILRGIYRRRRTGYYVIGDSGYSLRPWLLTPIANATPGTPEDHYNVAFKRTRATIERCNGVLKMRFRCLLKHRVLHYEPEKATKIINACAVLHNMCIANNEPFIEDDTDVDFGQFAPTAAELAGNAETRNADLEAGRRLQTRIVNNYFR